MRFSTVRLIAGREVRDLIRDRRTLMIVLVLPALLYPAFVVVGLAFAITMMSQKTVIGIVGAENLPKFEYHPESLLAGSPWLVEAERRFENPALIVDEQFATKYVKTEAQQGSIELRFLDREDEGLLQSRQVDAILVIPKDLVSGISGQNRPEIRILGRDGDETSKIVVRRTNGIVSRWSEHIKELRFVRKGLPFDFDVPIKITDPDDLKPGDAKTSDELRDVLVKFLPFLLVMWTMAGALHPAVDLTAGEKERGTMETLLISPTGRSEIVAGKFLAVFAFSYGSSLWNLLWMAAGGVMLGAILPLQIVSFVGLGWTALLAIPLAALFSAVAIGLGAFARSTKEGQYYLLPVMVMTLPLSLYAMTPGLKITPALSAIPISGLSMILQNLLAVSGEPISITCWVLGVGSMVLCAALGLLWAAWQFRRESVLFRSDTGFTIRGWWRSIMDRE